MDVRRNSYSYSVPFFTTNAQINLDNTYQLTTQRGYMNDGTNTNAYWVFEYGYNITNGGMSNTYLYSKKGNEYSIIDSFTLTGYGSPYGYGQNVDNTTYVTASGTRGCSWYDLCDYSTQSWDTATYAWGGRYSTTAISGDKIHVLANESIGGKVSMSYPGDVAITRYNVASVEANGRKGYFGERNDIEYLTISSMVRTVSEGAKISFTSDIITYTTSEKVQSYTNSYRTFVSSTSATRSVSSSSESVHAEDYFTSTQYGSTTSTIASKISDYKYATTSTCGSSMTSITQRIFDGYFTTSTTKSSFSLTYTTYTETNATTVEYLSSTSATYDISTTYDSDRLVPVYSDYESLSITHSATDTLFGTYTYGITSITSMSFNNGLMSRDYNQSYVMTYQKDTDPRQKVGSASYNEQNRYSFDITASSSTIVESSGYINLESSKEGFLVTVTAKSSSYIVPRMTISGPCSYTTGITLTGSNLPEDISSEYTSSSKSTSRSSYYDCINGKKSVVAEGTLTYLQSHYDQPKGGYLFDRTTYTYGESTKSTNVEHSSYYYIYDYGERIVFTLSNGVKDDILLTSGEVTSTFGESRVAYNITIDPGTLTDAYAHFDTRTASIIYTQQTSSNGTVTNYENAATFWYIKPDLNFTYTRYVDEYTYLKYKDPTGYRGGYQASTITTNQDTGLMVADEDFCVLYETKGISSWTNTYNTDSILTTYITSTIPSVIGGGSLSEETTMSNSYGFGYYAGTGTFYHNNTSYYYYDANTYSNEGNWYSTYTYQTSRTYNLGTNTTWYSTLTSAVWDTVVTTSTTSGEFTWDYTTKKSWWINETQSVGLRTTTVSASTRTSSTTTGNQIINQYTSETYIDSYTTSYTGISWFDNLVYGKSLAYSEKWGPNYASVGKWNLNFMTLELPVIYQSNTATMSTASEAVTYFNNSTGQTKVINRSVSVIVTSESPIKYSYITISDTKSITGPGSAVVSTKTATSFMLTSHMEAYSMVGSQGWYNGGFRTAALSYFIPDVNDFSQMTNFSGVRKSTDYIWYTWSHIRSYDESSYTDYNSDMSSMNVDIYKFSNSTKLDMLTDAQIFTSYSTVDLVNGQCGIDAKLMVGTSYRPVDGNNIWTAYHISSVESVKYYYDTNSGKYVRTSYTIKNPTTVSTWTVSDPFIFNVETWGMVDSIEESFLSSTTPYGTTIYNGTFFTASLESYGTRTFANGTQSITDLFSNEDRFSIGTTDATTTRTFIKTGSGNPVFACTTTDYASWNGYSYTANYLSKFNVNTFRSTLVDESRYVGTEYEYTATLDTYYITSIYGEAYTLEKAGSYTTNGIYDNGGWITRQYFSSVNQGYSTTSEGFGTFSSTASEKVVKVMTSRDSYKTVTYYDTYYKQSVQAIAEIKDIYTTYTTTSVFGNDSIDREPEYITAISSNSESFSGKDGKTHYSSTYKSGTVTKTKGYGY